MFNTGAKYFQVAQGVWGKKIVFTNIFMIANRRGSTQRGWVLVDAGLKGSARSIIKMAESLFGRGTKPSAIILTHGHFDHVGALYDLLKYWDVPVYAHPLEFPYLNGKSSYPPADPSVGGGLMSLNSWMYPTKPIDISDRLRPVQEGQEIPELPEWRIVDTPGHSPGHISLFLPLNTTLISGDAFVSSKAESAVSVLSYIKQLSGPPKYFTTDWVAAAESVRKLAALQPRIAGTGHGPVMRGKELQTALQDLADNFDELAVPSTGRYVGHPTVSDEQGVKYIPSPVRSTSFKLALTLAVAVSGFLIARKIQNNLAR